MGNVLLNISNGRWRNLFAGVAVILMLLTSCPVKSSIKNLAGIPVNTEQQAGKANGGFVDSASTKCASGETTDIAITQTPSPQTKDSLPAVMVTAAFLFLFSYKHRKEQVQSLYECLKIPCTVPIFLRYRKLVI